MNICINNNFCQPTIYLLTSVTISFPFPLKTEALVWQWDSYVIQEYEPWFIQIKLQFQLCHLFFNSATCCLLLSLAHVFLELHRFETYKNFDQVSVIVAQSHNIWVYSFYIHLYIFMQMNTYFLNNGNDFLK